MPEEYVKLTMRMPKKLVKELKQTALYSDSTVTNLAVQAFKDLLSKRRTK